MTSTLFAEKHWQKKENKIAVDHVRFLPGVKRKKTAIPTAKRPLLLPAFSNAFLLKLGKILEFSFGLNHANKILFVLYRVARHARKTVRKNSGERPVFVRILAIIVRIG